MSFVFKIRNRIFSKKFVTFSNSNFITWSFVKDQPFANQLESTHDSIFPWLFFFLMMALILYGLAYIFPWIKIQNKILKIWYGNIWNEKRKEIVLKLSLQKTIKIFFLLHGFLLIFSLINLIIITYFFFKNDVIFCTPNWFAFSNVEISNWYNIFVGLIFMRVLFTLITKEVGFYIKDSFWAEKKKKTAFRFLTGINFFTMILNFPFLGSFYAYLQGSEILSEHLFFGSFRRLLNESERNALVEKTFLNFLEKAQVSSDIKDQLKIWINSNSQTILEKFNVGSTGGIEDFLNSLEIQKEFFLMEAIKKNSLPLKPAEPLLFDQTLNVFTNVSSWVFNHKILICCLVVGVCIMIYYPDVNWAVLKWKVDHHHQRLDTLERDTRETIGVTNIHTDQINGISPRIANLENRANNQENTLNALIALLQQVWNYLFF